MWQVICADVMEWYYTGPKFHAILCDPPYALNFMNKAWDGNIAFQPSTWVALAEHLLPGGFIMAFASSRGWHRLACALEDAGLIIQPSIFGWLNGQSFPKATRIDTQIDAHGGQPIGWFGPWLRKWRKEHGITQKELAKHFPSKSGGLTGCVANWELGHNLPTIEQFNKLVEVLGLPFGTIEEAEREVIGKSKWSHQMGIPLPNTYNGQRQHLDITIPATSLARAWEGHRYGGQILKNALEPIIVAQKPWEGKRLDCIVGTGAGALWVDGGRIGTKDDLSGGTYGGVFSGTRDIDGNLCKAIGSGNKGRWPSNFILYHVPPDVNGEGGCRRVGVKRVKNEGYRANPSQQTGAIFGSTEEKTVGPRGYADPDGLETVDDFVCVESCPVAKFDEQAGERKSGGSKKPRQPSEGRWFGKDGFDTENIIYDDSGGPSRFYHNADWSHEIAERLAGADPVHYCPKAAKRERNQNLDDFYWRIDKSAPIGFVRIDKDEWEALGLEEEHIHEETGKRARLRAQGNIHSTVKPIALNKWLATLLLPPREYMPRQILIPFCGTMSEGIGAMLAGWEEIIGIDSEQEYCDIGEARIRFWSAKMPKMMQLGMMAMAVGKEE